MAESLCPPLDAAIDTATRERLAIVLRAIILESQEAQHTAVELLTTTSGEIRDPNADSKTDSHVEEREGRATPEPSLSKKPKYDATEPLAKRVKRYEMCEQCREEFDVATNWNEACYWHDGKSDPCSAL